jgi:catechol 2,3-dioxygenase-like lactoylglutathione lyase family enzyme
MFTITNTNISINIADMDQSIGFYTDVLGFKVLSRYGNHYAQVSGPGVVIGLHPSAVKSAASENISIGFTVDNFDDAKGSLDKSNVTYQERKEMGGSFIHFNDPDGTPLYFINPKR